MRFLGHARICNLGDEVGMSTYVEKLREKQFDVSALRIHKVLEYVNDNAISRQETNNLLSLINDCGCSVPKDIGSLTRKVDSRCVFLPIKSALPIGRNIYQQVGFLPIGGKFMHIGESVCSFLEYVGRTL